MLLCTIYVARMSLGSSSWLQSNSGDMRRVNRLLSHGGGGVNPAIECVPPSSWSLPSEGASWFLSLKGATQCHFQQYNSLGQTSRDRTRAEMSASTIMRANRVGLPGTWGKIFTECTWTDVAALAALDITNSAGELSVVETPRLPTDRARLFALGACAVTSFQD